MVSIKDLKPGAKIHLMGICGTAMASLAGLLTDMGFKVSGSELNPYPPMSTQIESLGIKIMKPYSAENLADRPDFVVVGNVISANNEEAQEMLRLNIPYSSLPQAMGEVIIAERESIVIAGTHGKTTTTSMMAWLATQLGYKPGFLIGGIAKNFAKSFQVPQGKYFIIEGDEYDTAYFDKVPKFMHYRPRHVLLTSIEFDHADIYADLAAVKSAFVKLMKLIPAQGTLVYNAEDQNIAEIVSSCTPGARLLSYGISRGDYRAQWLSTNDKFTQFRVSCGDSFVGEFSTVVSGEYNMLNFTAVIALAHNLGWDIDKLKKAVESFQGVKRRQEVLGEPNGILVIEDFAHHPTAVRETLKGLKQKYKGRKLVAIFEPRSATSRRKVFQKDYAQAFMNADEVLLMQAFDQSKIDVSERFSSEELASDIFKAGRPARSFPSVNEIIQNIAPRLRTGDMLVIMSNGGFDGIHQKLLKRLEA